MDIYAADARTSQVQFNEEVLEIDVDNKRVVTQIGSYPYRSLISTMPLKHLLQRIKQNDRFPRAADLRHISTLVVNVVLAKKRKRFHWVYLPGKDMPFYRVGFYPGQERPTAYLEKTLKHPDEIDKHKLLEEMIYTLKKLNVIQNPGEIVHFDPVYIPVSYILFDLKWHETVPRALAALKKQGIYSIGRYGSWNYTSMSDDVKAALETAKHLDS